MQSFETTTCSPKFQKKTLTMRQSVKNTFSDLTKVKIGWDWYQKDIMNDCQEKAFREGCHERE